MPAQAPCPRLGSAVGRFAVIGSETSVGEIRWRLVRIEDVGNVRRGVGASALSRGGGVTTSPCVSMFGRGVYVAESSGRACDHESRRPVMRTAYRWRQPDVE